MKKQVKFSFFTAIILILIGATTENPYFEVNRALLSRSLVFELTPLNDKEHSALVIKSGANTHRQDDVRDIPNFSHKYAIDTSAIDTVDVIVATKSRKKNSNAQT